MADPSLPERPGATLERSAHRWFSYSPLPARPPLSWPEERKLAVSVVLDVRAVEWEPPGSVPPIRPPGGRGIAPYPDFPRMSHREFGHRVGVFRLLDLLAAVGVTPAAVVDVLTVERYRRLIDHLGPRVSEFLAGGLSASRPITSRMEVDEERHYIRNTLDRLTAGLGINPRGWLGPEHSESAHTPALLAEAGLGYVADWGNDERPYPMAGLWSFPLSWELSDLRAMYEREVPAADWGRSIEEAFDLLRAEGGRMLAIHLHPWVTGQAFRADALERALTHLRASRDVWWASPAEIVDWCRSSAGDGR